MEIVNQIILSATSITNQQRFPISKFGWPLKEASEKIINGKPDWESQAKNIIFKHIQRRLLMKKLSDLYNLKELNKWSIDSLFVPWFSSKPINTKFIYDKDYIGSDPKNIVNKLSNLIGSIEKKGFLIAEKDIKSNILVYPISKKYKKFYIRAGNHRAAVLAALRMNIPCYIDRLEYLKDRDKFNLSKSFLGIRRLSYSLYPQLMNTEVDL